jgi:hypothetical protein
MFGSEVLEVGVGMALLFLFLSLIVTAVREFIEAWMQTRAGDLERGIRELLADQDGTGLADDFYAHPIIFSLFRGNYQPDLLGGTPNDSDRAMRRKGRLALPAYIPSRHFATALMDMAARGPKLNDRSSGAQGQPAAGPVTIEDLRATVGRIANDKVRCAIEAAMLTAGDDLEKVRANLEDWYNGTMDRVSGWYRKRTQWLVFWLGLAAAALLNVDAITVASRLMSDPTLRKAIVAQAEAYALERAREDRARDGAARTDAAAAPAGRLQPPAGGAPPEAPAPVATAPVPTPAEGAAATGDPASGARTPQAGTAGNSGLAAVRSAGSDLSRLAGRFGELGFPIGWPPPQLRTCSEASGLMACTTPSRPEDWADRRMLLAVPGWLITALAIMLGAPFWFDVLNKFMVVRSTVKPAEKSGQEGSEDRPAAAGPQHVRLEVAAVPSAAPSRA